MAPKPKLESIQVSEIRNWVPGVAVLADWIAADKQIIRNAVGADLPISDVVHRLWMLWKGKMVIRSLEDADDESAEDADARLKRAKADMAEIDRDREKGALVFVEDRNQEEAGRIAVVKSRLMGLPDKMRVRLGLSVQQTEDLELGIRDALNSIADELEAHGAETTEAET